MRLFFCGGSCLDVVAVVTTLLFVLFYSGAPLRSEIFALGCTGRSDRPAVIAIISQPQANGAEKGAGAWGSVVQALNRRL